MTLARRLATQLILLLACLTLTAGVGFWGVLGVRQDFSVALANYERLRQLYSVGLFLQSAKVAMNSDFPNLIRADAACKVARRDLYALAPDLPISNEQRTELLAAMDGVAARITVGRPASIDVPLAHLARIEPVLKEQILYAQLQADQRKQQTLYLLATVAGGAILVSIVLGIKQWRSVMTPLGAIADGVRRVSSARFDAPITLGDADREFVHLARDFNQMSAELSSMYGQLQSRVEGATRSLVQSERLAGVGLLAAGVAHEINNPLAIITGRIELLLARPCDESTVSSLKIALDEAFRCKQIINRLLTLSRGPSGVRREMDLSDVIGDVVGNVRSLPGAGNRKIELSHAEPVHVEIDEGEIKQVMLNLLINAIHATTDDGAIDVRIGKAAALAEVAITDNGTGMDDATLDHLFEPFFSKRPGEVRGTGLGLSISKAIIESHGGSIEATSKGTGHGSSFIVRLPISEPRQ